MKPMLNVYDLPRLVEPEALAGGTAVVIDVLRSTTTIAYALAAGAKEVIACREVSDALALAAHLPAEQAILGGERHGVRIDGFALGNSPEEYTPERVRGKTVLLTTTNGTRAMDHARLAEEVWVAALVNASAMVKRLLGREHVHILCAGTDGRPSEDDILMAGLLVERLQDRTGTAYHQNTGATEAREFWSKSFGLPAAAAPPSPERVVEELRKTAGRGT